MPRAQSGSLNRPKPRSNPPPSSTRKLSRHYCTVAVVLLVIRAIRVLFNNNIRLLLGIKVILLGCELWTAYFLGHQVCS